MKTRLVMGSFDAEQYWISEDSVKLPAFADKEVDNTVLAMDELLFLACDRNDLLITRFPVKDEQIAYLNTIGFFFSNNRDCVSMNEVDIYDKSKDIFRILCKEENFCRFKELILPNMEVLYFSCTPYLNDFLETYHLDKKNYVDEHIFKMVNSKVFSSKLNQRLLGKKHIQIVKSSHELEKVGMEYFQAGPIVIKEEFGVSGKGNCYIDSVAKFKSIIKYVQKQENKGKKVELIVEKFLDKLFDFSSQYYIDKMGECELISVQQIQNKNMSYHGSFTASEELLQDLKGCNYFSKCKIVTDELFRLGYCGHVCIDSMMLRNSEVEDVVEINARMSMSLLKKKIDDFLSKKGQNGYLSHLSLKIPVTLQYTDLLVSLEQKGILYAGENEGVIPLTPNSMFINTKINMKNNAKVYGRLYFAMVGENDNLNKFKSVLEDLNISIL